MPLASGMDGESFLFTGRGGEGFIICGGGQGLGRIHTAYISRSKSHATAEETTLICTVLSEVLPNILKFHDHNHCSVLSLELITFEILAAEQLRLMGFDNRLISDYLSNAVNVLLWRFATNDRFRSEKYKYITSHPNPFPEVNSLSKTHHNVKSNLKLKAVL